MASTPTISTRDRVHAICTEMADKGVRPTVRKVLAAMPDIRSTSSVHPHFAEWRDSEEKRQQAILDKLTFSPDFMQAFTRELSRLREESGRVLTQVAEESRDQRDAAIEALAKEEVRAGELATGNDQLRGEISAVRAELAESNKNHHAVVAEMKEQLHQQQNENRLLASKNEELRTENAKKAAQLQSLADHLEEARAVVARQLKERVGRHSGKIRQNDGNLLI